MAGGKCNSVHVKRRTRPSYSRRCKEKKSITRIESLPDELLFEILVHLSAEDIYNGAMLVCRKWYNTIRTHDFIHAHLQHSTPGLLVQNNYSREEPSIFVAIRQGQIEVSKLSYVMRRMCRWNSCNGLILDYDVLSPPRRIVNPAIKKLIFEIPPFSPGTIHHWWGIAYSAASKQYKVIRTYDHNIIDRDLRCDIQTVGVLKSWRRVCTQHISPASKNLLRNEHPLMNPILTEHFIHFVEYNHDHVLTLNVETETIAENPVPQGLEGEFKIYLSTGKSLSMFVWPGELCVEGWEMESETGEWTKMYKIDSNAHRCKLEELGGDKDIVLLPCGWLKYREVVVLRFPHPTRVHIAFNVRTHEIVSFELDSTNGLHVYKVHTNSLVGLV